MLWFRNKNTDDEDEEEVCSVLGYSFVSSHGVRACVSQKGENVYLRVLDNSDENVAYEQREVLAEFLSEWNAEESQAALVCHMYRTEVRVLAV